MSDIPIVTAILKQPTTTTGGKVQGLGEPDRMGGLILDGKKFDARIEDSITSASLERTIEGASTLTVTLEDPERFLMRGGFFGRRGEMLLDDLWFRVCAVDKQGDAFTVTFEDREIALMRRRTRPRKASRADMTRAEFAAMLVHEIPHLRFVCPQLHKTQTVAPLSAEDLLTRQQNGDADSDRERGIASGANLKIKTATATPAQIKVANRLLRVAEGANAGTLATLALLCAAIGESTMGAEPGTYTGKYQGPLQASPTVIDPHNFEEQARSFLFGGKGFQQGGAIKLARENPNMEPGEIATRVEASGEAGSFYNQYKAQAKSILDAFGTWVGRPDNDGKYTEDEIFDAAERIVGRVNDLISGVSGALTDRDFVAQPSTRTFVEQYEFSRGQPGGAMGEDTWTCILRLAKQVGWRCFVVAGVVYFISDYDLIRSRPRMTIGEQTKGVDNIDFSLDTSAKKPDTVTIECRAARWAAPPGTVVVLDKDLGPAHGAWIVSDILRPDLTDQATTITLTRASAPLLEPAPSISTRSTRTQDGGVSASIPEATGGTKSGKWKYAVDVPNTLNSRMRSFLDRVASFYDGTLVVTTTTNHTRLVAGTNRVSQHMGGGAADLGSQANWGGQLDGEGGFKIAIAGYRACGKSYSEAQRLANIPSYDAVPCEEGNVQILWRVPGHHDHVHFGTG